LRAPKEEDRALIEEVSSELAVKVRMRDKRFIAEHRGGPLRKKQQYQLTE
jgi:hypothetical protein